MRFMLALILSTLAAACLAKSDHACSIVVEYVSVYDGEGQRIDWCKAL